MSPSAPTPRGSGAREALTDAALLAVDSLLTAGAALRVTRFATTDVLGGWVLADPAKRLAERLEPATPPHPFGYLAPPSAPLHRLVSALDCPFCVGLRPLHLSPLPPLHRGPPRPRRLCHARRRLRRGPRLAQDRLTGRRRAVPLSLIHI